MLGRRRRRWDNIKTTLAQCLVFAGQLLGMPYVVIQEVRGTVGGVRGGGGGEVRVPWEGCCQGRGGGCLYTGADGGDVIITPRESPSYIIHTCQSADCSTADNNNSGVFGKICVKFTDFMSVETYYLQISI